MIFQKVNEFFLKTKKNKHITEKFKFKFIHLIRGRIILAFSVLIAIILVMQILSYVNITKLQTSLRDFAEENLAQQMQINSLASDIAKLSSHEQTYLLTGDDKYLTLFEDTQEIINIKKLTSH